MSDAQMYRLPVSTVSATGGFSFVQDRGVPQAARATSDGGDYLFSEHGIGTRPLALIGKWNEVVAFIGTKADKKIINQVPDMPEIYMKVCFLTPVERFTGLFPVGDTITHVVDHLSNMFVPTPPSAAGVSEGKILGNRIKSFVTGKNKKKKVESNDISVFFSFISQDDYRHIATKQITFNQILPLVVERLRHL